MCVCVYLNNRIYRYAGDCDITFFLGNIKGGIKDFQVSANSIAQNMIILYSQYKNFFTISQIRGLVRVVMKPMLSVMPLVGGVQIFYLNNPSINFNLVGVADVLDLPGFR